MRVLLLAILLLAPLQAYRLYTSAGVSSLPASQSVADVMALLHFNMAQLPLSLSDSQVALLASQSPLSVRPTSTMVLDLTQKALKGDSLQSCHFTPALNTLLNKLSETQQAHITFDLCRLQRQSQANRGSKAVETIRFFYLDSLYKESPESVTALLDVVAKEDSKVQMLLNDSHVLPTMRMLQAELDTDAETSGELVIDEVNFQIYVWFPVVLAFVLFFAVCAMCSLDFSNDTILYAKFITTDKQ